MALIVFLFLAFGLIVQAQEQPACASCHGEPVEDWKTHKHAEAGVSCTACHGPSEKHRAATGSAPPDRVAAPNEVAALCGTCHTAQRKEFDASKHGLIYTSGKAVRSANCNTCHGHHSQRAWKVMENGCARCHSQLPASCKETPKTTVAKVSCMNCHGKHTLTVARR